MTETARYELGDGSVVHVQYQPDRQDGARQVGAWHAPQLVEERLPTVVGVAREILDAVREMKVDSAEVSFGITLTGGLNWAVARASTESSFKVSLTWSGAAGPSEEPESGPSLG
jgi:hypothetical protein